MASFNFSPLKALSTNTVSLRVKISTWILRKYNPVHNNTYPLRIQIIIVCLQWIEKIFTKIFSQRQIFEPFLVLVYLKLPSKYLYTVFSWYINLKHSFDLFTIIVDVLATLTASLPPFPLLYIQFHYSQLNHWLFQLLQAIKVPSNVSF